MRLNDKGQCPNCKRKPLVYKRYRPRKYCARCDREFDIETGEQIENSLWRQIAPGVFEDRHFEALPISERQAIARQNGWEWPGDFTTAPAGCQQPQKD